MAEPFTDEQKERIFNALVKICGERIHHHETRPDYFTIDAEASYIDAWWTAAHVIGEELLGYDYCKRNGLQAAIEERAKVLR